MAVFTRTYLCLAKLSCLSSFRSFSSTMCSTNSEWPRGIKDGGESYRLAKNPCTTDSFKTKTTPGWVTDICPLFSKCFSALSFSPLTLHRREFMNLTNSFLALFESLPQRMSTLLPPLGLTAPDWSPLASELFSALCQLLPPTPWICHFI